MEDFSISLEDLKKDIKKKEPSKTLDSLELLPDDLKIKEPVYKKKPLPKSQDEIFEDKNEDDSLYDISLNTAPENNTLEFYDIDIDKYSKEDKQKYKKEEKQEKILEKPKLVQEEKQEQKEEAQQDKEEEKPEEKQEEPLPLPIEEKVSKQKKKIENSEDVSFVHGLYKASNYQIPLKIDILFMIFVSLIVLLIVWGSFASVDELTRGEGKVIPSSKIQKVQYFDGGIISEILVKEGEHVTIGQSLLKIDTTRVMASFDETQENIYSLEAKKVRLQQELKVNYNQRLPKLKFSKQLQENAQQYIQSEIQVFKNKFFERKNNLNIVRLQYLQRVQELKEIKATAGQLEEKLVLEKKQYAAMESLVKSGSKSKLELIDKEKEVNQIKNDLETTVLSISRTELSIAEAKSLMEEKKQTIKSTVSVELQEIIAEIKKIKSRLITDNDKLEKTTIKAPATGTIKQININTIGAVVQSGVDLMEIVPDSDILFIEAKIDPKDIAFISPDLSVLVKLTAYDFSIYGGLKGSIVEISADSIVDQDAKDGKSYYKVVVKTEKNYLEYNNEKLTIIPGMVASVDIITGKKTIIDFFLKPILKVKEGALHER